jgi:hypothetical protein
MKYTGNSAKYPFIKLSESKVGDRFIIDDAGIESASKKFVDNNGNPKVSYNFSVQVGTDLRTLSFSMTSMNNCAGAWGGETEEWVGKTVEVYLAKGKTGMMFLALAPVNEGKIL